jgi:hypothetical protein
MFTGPHIVTDGLVLSLDAANTKSYPGSGTTWFDKSGNINNGTLVNSPTYTNNPGYITFASDKYATTAKSNIALSAATFTAWVYPTQTQGGYTGIIFNRSGYNGSTVPATGLDLYSNNSVGYSWNDAVATYNWNSGLITPNNEWSMIAVTVSSTTATAYLCQSSGITTATNTVAHSSLSGLSFYIACDPFSVTTRAFIGRIAIATVHNRVLSAQEILQNYTATKSRYNL